MKKMHRKLGLICLSGFFLSSCDSFRHTFGLDHHEEDAFNVETNAPLSLPPQYNVLPPVDTQRAKSDVSDVAQEKLLGRQPLKRGPSSEKGSEGRFLNKASSGQKADKNIRETLTAEAEAEKKSIVHQIRSMKSDIKNSMIGADLLEDPQNDGAKKESAKNN